MLHFIYDEFGNKISASQCECLEKKIILIWISTIFKFCYCLDKTPALLCILLN